MGQRISGEQLEKWTEAKQETLGGLPRGRPGAEWETAWGHGRQAEAEAKAGPIRRAKMKAGPFKRVLARAEVEQEDNSEGWTALVGGSENRIRPEAEEEGDQESNPFKRSTWRVLAESGPLRNKSWRTTRQMEPFWITTWR